MTRKLLRECRRPLFCPGINWEPDRSSMQHPPRQPSLEPIASARAVTPRDLPPAERLQAGKCRPCIESGRCSPTCQHKRQHQNHHCPPGDSHPSCPAERSFASSKHTTDDCGDTVPTGANRMKPW